MTEIVWREPPESPQSPKTKSPYIPVFDELVKHPGRWALLKENGWPSQRRSFLHSAELTHPGQWECTGRGEGANPGRVHIYIRYVGPK